VKRLLISAVIGAAAAWALVWFAEDIDRWFVENWPQG
jgi:hypothetical protein